MVVKTSIDTTDSRRDDKPIQGFGRPKGRFAYALAAYIRDQTDNGAEMVDILLMIARDAVFRDVDGNDVRIPCRIADRLGAIDRLMDRGMGKVIQEVELVTDSADSEVQERLESMTVEELEAHLAKLDTIIDGQSEIVT